MAITASGIGSGLDVNGIVTQLMQLERRPVDLLNVKARDFEIQLSGYSKLRSAVSDFQKAMESLGSLEKFKIFSSSSADEDVVTASASSTAGAGTFSLDVQRLAENHKLGSASFLATDVFSGSLQLQIGSDTMSIDASGKTLAQIRTAINEASDNPGITATILNTSATEQVLVLTAEESGSANAITVNSSPSVNGGVNDGNVLSFSILNKDGNGDPLSVVDLDAHFFVDGQFEFYESSNTVTEAVDGITLNLKGVGESTIAFSRDDSSIKKSVENFVSAYNKVFSLINDLSVNELSGDSSIRSIQGRIRDAMVASQAGTGAFASLVQVGIKSDSKTGELSLDSDAFEQAMESDFNSVANLFAKDDVGVAFRLEELASQLLNKDNIIKAREDGLRTRIDDIDDQILNWEARLELKETALRSKFASLDSLVGSLQSTSAFLASKFS